MASGRGTAHRGRRDGHPRRDLFAVGTLACVVLATLMLLAIDFAQAWRSLGLRLPTFEQRRTGPILTRRPVDGDQVRPYLERARPVAPGRLGPGQDSVRRPTESAPITFVLDGDDLRAEGTITRGAVDAFERAITPLKEPPAADDGAGEGTDPAEAPREAREITVVLHSPGGIVDEAIRLARLIRAQGFSTRVEADGYCASSCPIVFAGGVKRTADENAWLGVHRVFIDPGIFGSLDDGIAGAQQLAAEVQTLLDDFGVDPMVWTRAMRTPKESLYFFTPAEMERLMLVTPKDPDPDDESR